MEKRRKMFANAIIIKKKWDTLNDSFNLFVCIFHILCWTNTDQCCGKHFKINWKIFQHNILDPEKIIIWVHLVLGFCNCSLLNVQHDGDQYSLEQRLYFSNEFHGINERKVFFVKSLYHFPFEISFTHQFRFKNCIQCLFLLYDAKKFDFFSIHCNWNFIVPKSLKYFTLT